MKELPLDIQEEILVRSQATDLIRCKSVCKSWNSLISSDRFVESHRNRHSNESGATRIISADTTIIGSSKGLVCISCNSSYYGYNTDFLVVNPFTGEVKELMIHPDDPFDLVLCVSGFGYDSSIDDFKVLIGHRPLPNENGLHLDVLELKKNIWRCVQTKSDVDYEYLEGNGILYNRALHWLHYYRYKHKFAIFSFDLSKEDFTETPLPKLDCDEWNLGTMKDHLCIFRVPNTDLKENDANMIWVMRNDKVSWERKLLPPSYDANKTRKDYIPRRDFVSADVNIWLLEEGSGAPVLVQSIDHPRNERHHKHIRLATYSECNYIYDEHVFVKSLVSPHGICNENASCNEEKDKEKKAIPDIS